MNSKIVAVTVFLLVSVVGISLTNMLFGGNEALRGAGSCGTGVSVLIGLVIAAFVSRKG